jgi:RHS repeat-associated protein
MMKTFKKQSKKKSKKYSYAIVVLMLIFIFCVLPSFAGQKVYFYHTDAAGTPMAMTDASGSVVWKADYKPFGEEQSITGSVENNEKFVGKEKDKETGLYYFGARYMDAGIGRFVSVDPVGPVDEHTGKVNERLLLNPQRINMYAYAGNNPYRFIDYLGLYWEYSQGSGQLTHVDDQTGDRKLVDVGYSGHGEGLNNPEKQNEKDIGPIPQGKYNIEPQQTNVTNEGKKLPGSMRLTPEPETDTFNRGGFIIHGDNKARDKSASHGCPVFDRPTRDQIGKSGDDKLEVVP